MSLLPDMRRPARGVRVDPDAELPNQDYPAPAPLLYQTMRLASHHIYGSSRLGVNGYWSKQYDAVWDYREASRKTDTVRLLGRLPWYTNSLNSHVEAYAVAPWGNTQALPSLAQHYLGQIQYELTNHLGNVQATVSDKKLAILDENSYRVAFHASLPAAYDYYPFGMLMKERTSMDTSAHPSYMSAVVSVPIKIGGVVTLSSGNTGVAYGATLSYGSGGVVMSGTNGELGIVISGLTPGLPAEVSMSISALADVAQLSAWDSTGTIMLGSKAVTSNGPWDLTFTPAEGTVVIKVGLFPYLPVAGQLARVQNVRWEQQVGVDYRTQLVRVGTRTGDKYEFGFNGKYKDNEIAGGGSSLNFDARLYNTRICRWLSIDPLQSKYPSLSPYAFAANSPIFFQDFDGRDFGVKINYDTKTITVVQNFYAINENARTQILAATALWNATNYKVGEGWNVKFEIHVAEVFPTLEITQREVRKELNRRWDVYKRNIANGIASRAPGSKEAVMVSMMQINFVAAVHKTGDAAANYYFGALGPESRDVASGGSLTAGVTDQGKFISMNTNSSTGDFGTQAKLVGHEVGHTFGLADERNASTRELNPYYPGDNTIMDYDNIVLPSQEDVNKIIEYTRDYLSPVNNGKIRSNDPPVRLLEEKGEHISNPLGIERH